MNNTSVQSRKVVGVAVLLVCLIGWWLYLQIPGEKVYLPADPQAKIALDLVKNHAAREDGTVAEALALMVSQLKEEGVILHEGEWRVASQGEDVYVVSKIIREKGSMEWFERDFSWRVNVREKWVKVISLAAQGLMPFENLPPLPHGSEIS